jgi:hypothetical protein
MTKITSLSCFLRRPQFLAFDALPFQARGGLFKKLFKDALGLRRNGGAPPCGKLNPFIFLVLASIKMRFETRWTATKRWRLDCVETVAPLASKPNVFSYLLDHPDRYRY